VPGVLNRRINNLDIRDSIYTVNHFYFEDKAWADVFYSEAGLQKEEAIRYPFNNSGTNNEPINIPDRPNDKTVIIIYGKEI
jgi:hypothetical protein